MGYERTHFCDYEGWQRNRSGIAAGFLKDTASKEIGEIA
jgi:hypothetical protein